MNLSRELKPEHARALTFLDSILSSHKLEMKNYISEEIWYEGKVMVMEKVPYSKDIPAGDTWRWNQTKGRKEAFLPNKDVSVVLAKLIPRKKSSVLEGTVPSYKLWRFAVTYHENNRCIYVLWCEKGKQNPTCEVKQKEEESKLYATKLSFICN